MKYTPSDHVDRKNLAQAIAKFKDLDSLFRQVKIKLNKRIILEHFYLLSIIPSASSLYYSYASPLHP